MAPFEALSKRYWVCPSGYSYSNGACYRSNWYNWGRWVVLAIAVGLFFIVLLSCLTVARRRRRRGAAPMYGTGWMAPQAGKWGNQNQHQMHNYNPNYQNYPTQNSGFQQQDGYGGYPPAPPPPAYGQQQQPQYTGTTFNTGDGYYATGATGVQPPQGTYQRDDVYGPPQGPPPGRKE
ncbi:chitin synthesis regulation, resistance to congo red-domain-containing protein [Mariannaea sp. PMI_226]|nr:chitin synthesis regulation, resistance to congo red-domain-containing protein [Mariannaea sp. PMI_226]